MYDLYLEFEEEIQNLLEVTEGCRPDMHKPDDQDLSATFENDDLDGMGAGSESEVVLKRSGEEVRINLANLIALARVGAAHIKADYDL